MERFAFKIDAALKANLYKICRLCGIDNPVKVPILLPNDSKIVDLDEPSLSQKINELVGFVVTKSDKMPQSICSLCVDKINDFYEFREMCYATNRQTRELLGLKQVEPNKATVVVKNELQPQQLSAPLNKRGRKRKTEEKPYVEELPNVIKKERDQPGTSRKKQRLQIPQLGIPAKTEIKDEPLESAVPLAEIPSKVPGKKGRKAICTVCAEKFSTKEQAEEHKHLVHIPNIPRYICNACDQTHHNNNDIKAHQLWHKLSKTSYKCPVCDIEVPNSYAFSRHLREHTTTTAVELQVFDRECPLCKKTFVTNYFYNTHPCAIRTKKCGGCSRTLSSESTYMRHAPICPRIYLNHSKHILPEAANTEAEMRIKNEFDVEDTAYAADRYEMDVEANMQPVVLLERLSSPLLRSTLGDNTLSATKGKSSERVSSKKYLQRCAVLLKSTMSTLVSIKHEPEVHIDDTGLAHVEDSENDGDNVSTGMDDFHAANDDSDDDASFVNASNDVSSISVKQEPCEGVQIKQEPKTFALKLKITKTQGQLNSSLIDDNDEMQPKVSKKKKKRKHKERHNETGATNAPTGESVVANDLLSNAIFNIKQERIDEEYEGTNQATDAVPEPTVMTSIPMTQLESGNSYENQAETQSVDTVQHAEGEPQDVKPNRMELDRFMQIAHIASGVDMAEEATPMETAIEATSDENYVSWAPSEEVSPAKVKPSKSSARKSTGGVHRERHKVQTSMETATPMDISDATLPQIVAVESGAAVAFENIPDIVIKPEPTNRGYADEVREDQEECSTEEINHNDKPDDGEEESYISSLDFSNVSIKQEKDLDISDTNINGNEHAARHYNGLDASTTDEDEDDEDDDGDDDDDDDDDSVSSADEANETTFDDQEEVRIYRELELPPLEPLTDVATEPLEPLTDVATENPTKSFGFVITSVCSQIETPRLPTTAIPSSPGTVGPASPTTVIPASPGIVASTSTPTLMAISPSTLAPVSPNAMSLMPTTSSSTTLSLGLLSPEPLAIMSVGTMAQISSENKVPQAAPPSPEPAAILSIGTLMPVTSEIEEPSATSLSSKPSAALSVGTLIPVSSKNEEAAASMSTENSATLSVGTLRPILSENTKPAVSMSTENSTTSATLSVGTLVPISSVNAKPAASTSAAFGTLTPVTTATEPSVELAAPAAKLEEPLGTETQIPETSLSTAIEMPESVAEARPASTVTIIPATPMVTLQAHPGSVATVNLYMPVSTDVSLPAPLPIETTTPEAMATVCEAIELPGSAGILMPPPFAIEPRSEGALEQSDNSKLQTGVASEAAAIYTEAIIEPKDNETEAQPFVDASNLSSCCNEEQQNELNHELSAQPTSAELPTAVIVFRTPPTVHDDEQAQCSGLGGSNDNCSGTAETGDGSVQIEETENRINEQQQQEQLQQRCQNDDSNINEIAENNNNANIERELQDDVNAAQENLDI